jgi:transcriptional regulator with XRE-family HTH domain
MGEAKQTERTEAKAWAQKQGLSGRDIAKICGISRQTVTKFLRGVSNSSDVAEALRELGCPEEYLGKVRKKPEPTHKPVVLELHDPWEAGDVLTPPGIPEYTNLMCPLL